MRALKILVVVMGVLIVIGFAALIAGIAGKLSRDRPGASVERPFGATAVDIPRGARIEAMTASQNRLILELALPGVPVRAPLGGSATCKSILKP